MKEKKTVFKLFFVWDFEKEEIRRFFLCGCGEEGLDKSFMQTKQVPVHCRQYSGIYPRSGSSWKALPAEGRYPRS